ncbi:MAG: phosphoribosylanthranilate isomerase [Flavobacterium sp.]|nr:phosphoribosylanthranilate isomerase [Flavobacterium sp.]
MKYAANIEEVSALLPDYLGFIFYEKSSRFFDGEMPNIPKSIKKVGVFVNETETNIIKKINQYNLDFIQLHGEESAELCKKLQIKDVQIIKVFSVDDDFDFSKLDPFETVCDYYLFDTKGKLHGGNGTTFNWGILQKYKSKKPFFLSGGLGLEEIDQLYKLNLPIFAIDVNSKFEIQPGLKNTLLLKKINLKN